MTRVVIACAGLGRVYRGFETLARECFDAVRDAPGLRVTLLKGAGRAPGRDSRTVGLAARVTGRDVEMVTQQAFGLAALPHLLAQRPDVVFVSEWWTSLALVRLRRLARLRFRLLLSNGGPYEPGSYGWADHVHQPTEHELEAAVAAGMPRERQTLLPQGVVMDDDSRPLPADARAALRERLGLPREGPILLSVAALNSSHKRVDWLAAEVARLPEPRPHLVLLGERDAETPQTLTRVRGLLGPGELTVRSVPHDEVGDWYRAADVFVLASLWEAFGRAMIEAMSYGLPCVTQEGPTPLAVLGDEAFAGDLREHGGLAAPLAAALASAGDPDAAEHRHRYVHERYSWDRLAPRYADMFERCAVG